MSEQPPAVTTRKRIGPFSITAVLGEGGMGTVYRATRKGEEAAVKMIRPSLLDKADIRQRFEREAELLKSVDNPHVARIIGFDATKKTAPWLATEFIDGPTLREWTKEGKKLNEETWVDIAEGVLSGLAAIHAKGIIHRDIKPANVMMSGDTPKIIDFGISKEEGQTAFTQTQMFAGTVAYMAPERADGNEESQASDIYSAGLTLAYAAKGEHPFGDETSQSELSLLLKMSSEAPSLEGLSQRQQKLLLSLLERDPSRRPSATQALGILRGDIEPNPPAKPPTPRPVVKKTKALRMPRVRMPQRRAFGTDIRTSLIRGSVLGIGPFVAVFVVSVLTAGANAPDRISQSAAIAAWLAGDALRLIPTSVPVDWLVDPAFVSVTQVAIRPLAITALIVGLMIAWGRKYSKVLAGHDTQKRLLTAGALIIPAVIPAVALSWIFRGDVDWGRGSLALSGMMPWDALFAVVFLGVSFLVGLMAAPTVSRQSIAHWWVAAAARWSLLVLGLIVLVSLGASVYLFLSPDFAPATLNPEGGPFDGRALGEYVRVVFWVLALAPALLAMFSSAALSLQAEMALRNNDKVFFELFATESDGGPVADLVPADPFITAGFLLAVALAAVIAGAYASHRASLSPVTTKSILQVVVLSVVVAALGAGLLSSQLTAESPLRGTLFVHSSGQAALVSTAAIAVLGALVTGLVIVAGLPQVRTVVDAVFTRLTGKPPTSVVTRVGKKLIPWPQLGGIATIALATAVTLVAPTIFGSLERSVANQFTPRAALADFAQDIEVQDAAGLKALLGDPESGNWLPDGALEVAQPELGSPRTIEITDTNGRSWRAGELGALATIAWGNGSDEVSWDVSVDTEVSPYLRYARIPQQRVIAEPVEVVLSADSDLSTIPEARISVNGERVQAGRYLAVPGQYDIRRDGVLLLAPFTASLTTRTDLETIEIPSVLSLPSGADEMMETVIDEQSENCGSIFNPRCFDRDDIDRYEERISGSIPGNYYDRASSGLQDGGIQCWEPDDRLISATEMERRVKCEQTVTSQTVYYDSRTIAEPVYSQRCARYGYSWWFGFYCTRYETYQSGTNYRTVRGGELATVKYRSEIPFFINVLGGLDDAGEFQIVDAAIE